MRYGKNQDDQQNTDLEMLIEAARNGDQSACAAIYREFVRPTYRLCYGVLLNEQDAEEVMQDSMTYAFRNLHHFDSTKSSFRTWLYTISMSRCRNKRRRKWLPQVNLADVAEWLPGSESPPESVIEHEGVRDIIFRGLKQLSPKLREAVVLRYFDGLSYREMAEVLNCPQKTAESRIRLAHQNLRDILIEYRDGLPEGVFNL